MTPTWQSECGTVQLYLGDCLDVLPHLEGVDAVIADPPYGTTRCQWDSVIPLQEMWRHLDSASKSNAATVLFCAQPFTSALVMSNPNRFGYSLVWEKSTPTGHLNSGWRPLKSHEDIAVFYSERPTYNAQKWIGTPNHSYRTSRVPVHSVYGQVAERPPSDTSGVKHPRSVLRFQSEHGLHPTQKPLLLLEYLVSTYTEEGDLVLDFCIGSGTTGVACARLGRKFIGIEIEPRYFEIAKRRIYEALNSQPLFVGKELQCH